MTLEQAKEKVLQVVKDNPAYESEYRIDENGIVETDFAWYIPFIDIEPDNQNILVGSYNGFIVGKKEGDLHQPGSGLDLDKWMTGYKLGLLDGPHDLVVTNVNDRWTTKDLLKKLNLQYFRPKIEHGTTWKIPKTFTDNMIDEKLSRLPCTFRNQRFTFNIDDFQAITDSKAFDYELRKAEDSNVNEIGERIE